MRSVNVAELKNKLSAYLAYAKAGEEIVVRERNLPIARLVPFTAEDATEEELRLAAAGIIRLPEKPFDYKKFSKLPKAKVKGNVGTQALLDDRNEGW